MSATTSQIAMIHALKSRAGMDDDAYRDFLQAHFRASSSKQLSLAQAGAAIDRLKVMAGQAVPAAKGAVAGLDSAIGRKLRALWIAAHHLGLLHDRSDTALLSFLQRQTGVSHTRFLQHPSDATAAIEALKSWLARDGGVVWPTDGDAVAAKRAVIEAQWRRLAGCGVPPGTSLDDFAFKIARRAGWKAFEREHYEQVQQALGRKLRVAWSKYS